jgi:hypothetical protein
MNEEIQQEIEVETFYEAVKEIKIERIENEKDFCASLYNNIFSF